MYSPIWDKSRSAITGRRHENADVVLASNFECGNGFNFRQLGPGSYACDVEPEPGSHIFSDKGYYFCFAVVNKRARDQLVTLQVAGGQERFGSNTQFVIAKRGAVWSHLPAERILTPPDDRTIAFQLDLPGAADAGPAVFVSDYHWYPYTEMTAYLKNLVSRRGDDRGDSKEASNQGIQR